MENIQWQSQPVVAAVDALVQNHSVYATGCEDVLDVLGDVASVYASETDADSAAKVAELQAAAVKLLQARRSAQVHSEALRRHTAAYQAGGEPTDFVGELKQKTEELEAAQPYRVEADPLYHEFLAEARLEGGDGDADSEGGGGPGGGPGGGEEFIDDDIAIEGGAAQLAPNPRCPLTAKALLELDEPVQDLQGVVYERAAVEQYFATLPAARGGRANIMAGSAHAVSYAEMVPAERVIREKRRQLRRKRHGGGAHGAQQQGGGGAAGGGHDVLDV